MHGMEKDWGYIGSAPGCQLRREVIPGLGTLGLEVVTLEIRRSEDIAATFEALTGRADALYAATDARVTT